MKKKKKVRWIIYPLFKHQNLLKKTRNHDSSITVHTYKNNEHTPPYNIQNLTKKIINFIKNTFVVYPPPHHQTTTINTYTKRTSYHTAHRNNSQCNIIILKISIKKSARKCVKKPKKIYILSRNINNNQQQDDKQ